MFAKLAKIRAIPARTLKSSASGAPRIRAWPAAAACANDNSAGSRVAFTRGRRARPVLSCHWVRDAVSGRLECRWTEEKSRQTAAEDPYSRRMMSRVYAQGATALRSAAAMSPGRTSFRSIGTACSSPAPWKGASRRARRVRLPPSFANGGGQGRKAVGRSRMDSRVLPGVTAERARCRRVVATTGFARSPSRAGQLHRNSVLSACAGAKVRRRYCHGRRI
jgi:hypothetical protein